jgi:hypothetical protein
MQSQSSFSETSRPFLTWQRILDWAQEHYRCRTFSKDERIPARPGLLYLVQRGAIRMVGTAQVSATASQLTSRRINRTPEERRASANKAHATARARREREAAARDEALKYAGGLREEIAALTHKLDELKRVEQISAVSCVMTGKVLLRQEEIVAAAIPWKRSSGVYFLIDGAEVAYVGQSVNVHSRIGTHADKQFDKYAFVPCEPDALDKLESLYIHCLRPKLNATNPDQSKAAPIKLDALVGVKGINK